MPEVKVKREEERENLSTLNDHDSSPVDEMMNEAEGDLVNQLNFIAQSDANVIMTKDVEAYDHNSAVFSTEIAPKVEEEATLTSELKFISRSKELQQKEEAKDEEDNTKVEGVNLNISEKILNKSLSSELEFISQSKELPQEQEEAEKENAKVDAVDVLKFISQPADPERKGILRKKERTKKVKNAKVAEEESSFLDGLNILSKSSSVKRKQDAKVEINDNNAKKQRKVVDVANGISNTASVGQTTKRKKSPIKHMIAAAAFSAIASLMTFAYLRIGLGVFCPYDEKLNTYVVIEKVEQCPVPIPIDDKNDTCYFWKKCPEAVEGLVEYVPAPAGKRHEILCRGTFNILHIVAALLHPNINYKKTMPQVHLHSPCPEIPIPAKKKKMNILQRLLSGKQSSDLEPDSTEESSEDGDELDWTLYVSASFDLDLTSKQKAIARKVSENLKMSLSKKYPMDAIQGDWFEQRLDKVQFGGSFPWWHPVKDKWGKDQEESGLRLVAAYLKIMNWPEVSKMKWSWMQAYNERVLKSNFPMSQSQDLQTKYPFSGVCTDGCPADFAIANTLEFREKYQPWKISPSVYKENRKGWVFVQGYSPTRYHPDPAIGGASVLWMRPGLHKMESEEPFSRAIINALDACIADAFTRSGGKMSKCNIVLDCDDVGLTKIPPIGPTKRVLKILQDNYPDKLGTFVITNTSGAAQIFLKVLLPLLPAVVRQKIHIIPNDKVERSQMLKALVHEDFIPTWLGGTNEYTFDVKEYYNSSKYKSEFMTDEESVEYLETMPYYGH